MTEAEWLECKDPEAMLESLRDSGWLTERKARLFAIACCRHAQPRLWGEAAEGVLAAAERHADVFASEADLWLWEVEAEGPSGERPIRRTWSVLRSQLLPALTSGMAGLLARLLEELVREVGVAANDTEAALRAPPGEEVRAARAAWAAAVSATAEEWGLQCQLLRDIAGNPFRPLPPLDRSLLTWNKGLLSRLARAAYRDRQLPGGTLDPGRLAVLADALEEAGCTDAEVLGHLRSPGPHVRGCWALDLILGKE